MRLSPSAYRRITVIAAVLVGIIIVTGAAVRLTGSGLGCPSWPNCSPGRLTPHSATSYHAMVEFVNRTFTGAVSIGVIAAVLGSLLRTPRRRDLTWLSLGLVGFAYRLTLLKMRRVFTSSASTFAATRVRLIPWCAANSTSLKVMRLTASLLTEPSVV
jgi:heme A synthase